MRIHHHKQLFYLSKQDKKVLKCESQNEARGHVIMLKCKMNSNWYRDVRGTKYTQVIVTYQPTVLVFKIGHL